MNPADYDAWYHTARGRWVGETEYALAARLLAPQAGDSLLDIGCGTGWFTRRAAADDLVATGLDPSSGWLDYARAHSSPAVSWVEGDARALPFADAGFDHVLSIAALCFVDDERQAVAEAVRVARRSFAIGWLNRSSLLYWQKGRDGGSGAYRGARWHSAGEVHALFSGLPVRNLKLRSAIFLPSATRVARCLEQAVPAALPWGGLLLATGEKA
ncbi:MAG TPA: class I SAM-dependent methyltransferase [Thiobacillus sp.]|nr:MAG: SAM-dependent methyltransferase [Hydrogenophilales bacterium 16-64-40]OZA34941.1 MAG: SAM-dependent methyltransferase [Hydrogenophilales bacterium 17-64-65]HQS80953.1 class I SAM-dependent methyltransferase [Thiobacillus sp.]HQT33431.1 class I SAM-dependent methyltransferase [Thiobacillus sp.]